MSTLSAGRHFFQSAQMNACLISGFVDVGCHCTPFEGITQLARTSPSRRDADHRLLLQSDNETDVLVGHDLLDGILSLGTGCNDYCAAAGRATPLPAGLCQHADDS